jgi:hypothetical protein
MRASRSPERTTFENAVANYFLKIRAEDIVDLKRIHGDQLIAHEGSR